MSLINHLHWRYATKKFNPLKTIPEEEITEILKAMNLAPSASGLQPYQFVVIHDKKLQAQLAEQSFGQAQVSDASHLIVIAAQKSTGTKEIENYIQHVSNQRKQTPESLEKFKSTLVQTIASKSPQDQLHWAQRQCYIPLGVLVALCSEMKIDACPLEHFMPEGYDEILGFSKQGITATVAIALGYRSENDETQHDKKVRKSLEEIVQLRY